MQDRNEKFLGNASVIRAVIFDYGDVLCRRAPAEDFAAMAKIMGITPERLIQRYMQNRLEYDRGDVTPEEYWQEFARENGRTLSAAEIAEIDERDLDLWWHVDPVLMDWTARLRARGIKAGILSNMFLGMAQKLRRVAWAGQFDDYTLSSEIRVTKPDPRIYLHSAKGLGVNPSAALFLDDREVNITGARAVGMEGLLFQNTVRLREDLEAWGFPVLPEPEVALKK